MGFTNEIEAVPPPANRGEHAAPNLKEVATIFVGDRQYSTCKRFDDQSNRGLNGDTSSCAGRDCRAAALRRKWRFLSSAPEKDIYPEYAVRGGLAIRIAAIAG
jgi:hypothetical protein